MGWQESHLAQCFGHPGIVKGEEVKYYFLGFWVNHEVASEKKPPWFQAGSAIPSPFCTRFQVSRPSGRRRRGPTHIPRGQVSPSAASYLFLCLPWILMAAQGIHVKKG